MYKYCCTSLSETEKGLKILYLTVHNKMNKLIVLTAVTMVLYGKAHCNCNNTYDIYRNITELYSDNSILRDEQFVIASRSIVNASSDILKNKAFIVDSELTANVR